ncbi:trypsin-like serine peptidase [Rhizobium sp. Leaf453]|uniref:trypsin-like serine peptidase n=1 Tax=Rhizobium sp. Leaf453 TaxID=1736380 RepID=UPI0009E9C4FC|nr:trypsin-like peptidase domain-containing protein [Rhizobium sp. Leaf453]
MPHVTDTNIPPYDAIGLFGIDFGKFRGWGTASLIDERYLLTCAHNVFYESQSALSGVFHRAYNSPNPPGASGVKVDCAFIKRAFKTHHDRSWDIAVLRLDGPIHKIQPLRLGLVTENEQPDRNMLVAGYPGSHNYRMWEEEELVRGFNVPEHIFAYTHETETGVSGSPLFRKYLHQSEVYGVHSGLAENLEDKVGVLITEDTNAFIQQALSWRHHADHFVVVLD